MMILIAIAYYLATGKSCPAEEEEIHRIMQGKDFDSDNFRITVYEIKVLNDKELVLEIVSSVMFRKGVVLKYHSIAENIIEK